MRHLPLSFLFGVVLCLPLLTGCGSEKSAEPVVALDEIGSYLSENPDQNANLGAEEMENDEE